MVKEIFDEVYFQRGIQSKKSLYQNYKWMANVSLPIANQIKQMYPEKSILDFGCGRGYLVHALHLLNVEAYGYDISKYAVNNCHPEIKQYISRFSLRPTNVTVIKDVLEHVAKKDMKSTLERICENSREHLVIVPLGENGKYRIIDYEMDKTHIIRENEEWWLKQFINTGFIVDEFSHECGIIKKKWVKINPEGNGFYKLRRK